jgi:hypothetical protein
MYASGRRVKPRLYGGICVISPNCNYCVNVIGHYHI